MLARMRRSMTRLGLYARKLSFALGRGSPVKATLEQVQSQNADVLVATKQRRGHVATSVLGHINSLLARSRCDMLIGSRDKPAELLLDPQAMTNYCLHPTAKRLNPLDFHGKRPAPTARQPRSGNPEDAAASRVQDGQTNRPSASCSDIDGQGRSIP
ncbi:MAG: hypothetical protein ABI696_13370 [Rubrivivax sp.]